MNTDVKELLETAAVILLVIIFAVCAMLCVKWGVAYQTLVVFAGFIGTLLGVLGNKLRAGNSNSSQNPKAPDAPQVPNA